MCLQSLEVLLRRPEDNRNQIRELAQTLMDGGVLDELIQQKLDAFNTRWDELMARVRHYYENCVLLMIYVMRLLYLPDLYTLKQLCSDWLTASYVFLFFNIS